MGSGTLKMHTIDRDADLGLKEGGGQENYREWSGGGVIDLYILLRRI